MFCPSQTSIFNWRRKFSVLHFFLRFSFHQCLLAPFSSLKKIVLYSIYFPSTSVIIDLENQLYTTFLKIFTTSISSSSHLFKNFIFITIFLLQFGLLMLVPIILISFTNKRPTFYLIFSYFLQRIHIFALLVIEIEKSNSTK